MSCLLFKAYIKFSYEFIYSWPLFSGRFLITISISSIGFNLLTFSLLELILVIPTLLGDGYFIFSDSQMYYSGATVVKLWHTQTTARPAELSHIAAPEPLCLALPPSALLSMQPRGDCPEGPHSPDPLPHQSPPTPPKFRPNKEMIRLHSSLEISPCIKCNYPVSGVILSSGSGVV